MNSSLLKKTKTIVFLIAFTFVSISNSALAFYPNQKKGHGMIINMGKNYQANKQWGVANDVIVLYGITDNLEVQSITSLAVNFNKWIGGLNSEWVKLKYKIYDSGKLTIALAGGMRSPGWFSDITVAPWAEPNGIWKPSFHVILDWMPNRTFGFFGQLYYTSYNTYAEVVPEFVLSFSLTKKWTLYLYNVTHFNTKDIKLSYSIPEMYLIYQLADNFSFGGGPYYTISQADASLRNIGIITFIFINF